MPLTVPIVMRAQYVEPHLILIFIILNNLAGWEDDS